VKDPSDEEGDIMGEAITTDKEAGDTGGNKEESWGNRPR
jgi:hypothetical protein